MAIASTYTHAEEYVKTSLFCLDQPNQDRCIRLWKDNLELFLRAPGSSHNHQAWTGGYVDHIAEVMRIGYQLYFSTEYSFFGGCQLPFSFSDLLLVLFLHDLEKPWKYDLFTRGGDEARKTWGGKKANHEFRLAKIAEYGIVLTPYQLDALTYVEGEGDDYSSERRVMNELAGMAHICDVASARILHDKPDPEYRAVRR